MWQYEGSKVKAVSYIMDRKKNKDAYTSLHVRCEDKICLIFVYLMNIKQPGRHLYVGVSLFPDLALHSYSYFCDFIANLQAGICFQTQKSLCTHAA